MSKITEWKIYDILNILLCDIGADKFESRPNHIKIEFENRKKYSNLWVLKDLPWKHPIGCPRKWDNTDERFFRNYLLEKYGKEATYKAIEDAIKCLKSRV